MKKSEFNKDDIINYLCSDYEVYPDQIEFCENGEVFVHGVSVYPIIFKLEYLNNVIPEIKRNSK